MEALNNEGGTWHWRNISVVKNIHCPCGNLSSVPRTYTVAHNCNSNSRGPNRGERHSILLDSQVVVSHMTQELETWVFWKSSVNA